MLNLPGVFISQISGRIESKSKPMSQSDLHFEEMIWNLILGIYANWGNALRGMYVVTYTPGHIVNSHTPEWWTTSILDDAITYWRVMR